MSCVATIGNLCVWSVWCLWHQNWVLVHLRISPLIDWGPNARNRLIWVILIEVFTPEICLIESFVVNDGWSYFVCCLYLCLSIIASPDTGYLTTARQHNNYTISSHHSNQCLPSAIKINNSQLFNIQYK